MLKLLSDQIEKWSTPNKDKKYIRILVCNDDLETHIKRELLLKETNYSPNHVFLDVQDDVDSLFVVHFIDKCMDRLASMSKKRCCCNGLGLQS